MKEKNRVKSLRKILKRYTPNDFTVYELLEREKYTFTEFFAARNCKECSHWEDDVIPRKNSIDKKRF